MKIKKFNKATVNRDNIEEFVDNLRGTLDDEIIDWIPYIAKKTKLKNKYKKITKKFLKENNLKKSLQLLEIRQQRYELEKQIKKLEKKEENLSIYSDSELIYIFEEELLRTDIENFYLFFLKDTIEDFKFDKEHYPGDFENSEIIYEDVHPLILKKYKNEIDEIISIKINTNKYNL